MSNLDAYIKIRIPSEIRDELNELAKEQYTTTSELVRRLIIAEINKKKTP